MINNCRVSWFTKRGLWLIVECVETLREGVD